jgi:hypothetical protein
VLQLLPRERALIARVRTPDDAQRWLGGVRFDGDSGKTLRAFRGVLQHKTAHCLEGALAAAFVLQHHGHPPLLLDLRSDDLLDHVLFLWHGPDGWGAVGQSQYPALRGRRACYRTVRDLAWSYADPYVDETGRLNGYATFDLRTLGGMDWALSDRNVWRIERALLDNPSSPLRASDARHDACLRRYRAWKAEHADAEPPASFYRDHARFLDGLAGARRIAAPALGAADGELAPA